MKITLQCPTSQPLKLKREYDILKNSKFLSFLDCWGKETAREELTLLSYSSNCFKGLPGVINSAKPFVISG